MIVGMFARRSLACLTVSLVTACVGPEPGLGGGGQSTGSTSEATGTTAEPTTTAPTPGSGSSRGGVDETGSSGAPSGSTGAPPSMVVHVVSFNLLHGFPSFGDLDARTAIVADWIDEHQPDVIAVQEVGQTPLIPNRAEVLADMTGYQWAWVKASGVDFAFEEGPGVLSRWPITWVDDVMLPHPGMGGFEVRRTLGVGLDTPGGELAVFSAHLTNQDDETISADQALTAYEFVDANTGALGGFLAGDMNAEPDSLAMRMLRGEMGHRGVLGDLVDAWRDAYPRLDGFTAPSDVPDHRIDYVYVVPGATGPGAVQTCALILAEPVDGLYASDHIGVSCEVALPLSG